MTFLITNLGLSRLLYGVNDYIQPGVELVCTGLSISDVLNSQNSPSAPITNPKSFVQEILFTLSEVELYTFDGIMIPKQNMEFGVGMH